MRELRRQTILTHLPCDLKRLPLSSLDAFVLTLIDGKLALGEIADLAGMTLAELFSHADRLAEVGAVGIVDKGPARRAAHGPTPPRRVTKTSLRPPPANAEPSPRTPPSPKTEPPPRAPRHSRTPPPTKATRPTRAPPAKTVPPPSMPPPAKTVPPARRTTRSSQALRKVRSSHHALERPRARPDAAPDVRGSDAPALDEATVAAILERDARLAGADHYAVLGVDRGSEKSAIKRAYFALAAQFHPDRYFGKDLGKARAALQRVFTRLTAAHDTLANRARRAEYDASLPPVAAPSRLRPPRPPPSRRRPNRPWRCSRPPRRSGPSRRRPLRAQRETPRPRPPPSRGGRRAPTTRCGASTSPRSTRKCSVACKSSSRPPRRR